MATERRIFRSWLLSFLSWLRGVNQSYKHNAQLFVRQSSITPCTGIIYHESLSLRWMWIVWAWQTPILVVWAHSYYILHYANYSVIKSFQTEISHSRSCKAFSTKFHFIIFIVLHQFALAGGHLLGFPFHRFYKPPLLQSKLKSRLASKIFLPNICFLTFSCFFCSSYLSIFFYWMCASIVNKLCSPQNSLSWSVNCAYVITRPTNVSCCQAFHNNNWGFFYCILKIYGHARVKCVR